jgi:coenzyme PQQ synthesis protein D (PqqD)
MKATKLTKPRARKEGLVVQDLPDETLVYDLERDRAHCLNQTAAFVWRQCDGKMSPREIASALKQKTDTPVDEKLVWLALDQLGRNHLLTDLPVPPPKIASMNRRELVRVLGISAAVALPVVASIVAPVPAQAATGCASSGQSCATLGCCSGCVCSNSPDFLCTGSC